MQAYADYHDMMDLTEELIRAAALEVTGAHAVDYQGQNIDFGPAFRRASMHDLVKEITGISSFGLGTSLERVECASVSE